MCSRYQVPFAPGPGTVEPSITTKRRWPWINGPAAAPIIRSNSTFTHGRQAFSRRWIAVSLMRSATHVTWPATSRST
jgi:hypothetical protein